MDEFYRILGLKLGASQEEIKQAYRDLVRVWHPDRFVHDARLQKIAEEKLKEINSAYEVLNQSENIAYQQSSTSNQEYQDNPAESEDEQPDDNYTHNQIFSALKFVALLILVVVSIGFVFPGVFAVYALSVAYLDPVLFWIICPTLILLFVGGVVLGIKKMIYRP